MTGFVTLLQQGNSWLFVPSAVLLGALHGLEPAALGGLYFGRRWNTETTEPYFQVVSAAMIIAVAVWMLWRTWRHRAFVLPEGHAHDEVHRIDTGHGVVQLQIFEDGVPPRFRVHSASGISWPTAPRWCCASASDSR